MIVKAFWVLHEVDLQIRIPTRPEHVACSPSPNLGRRTWKTLHQNVINHKTISFRLYLVSSTVILAFSLFLIFPRKMKVIAAYLLAVLGGNTSPSAEDIKNILGSGTFFFFFLGFLSLFLFMVVMLYICVYVFIFLRRFLSSLMYLYVSLNLVVVWRLVDVIKFNVSIWIVWKALFGWHFEPPFESYVVCNYPFNI